MMSVKAQFDIRLMHVLVLSGVLSSCAVATSVPVRSARACDVDVSVDGSVSSVSQVELTSTITSVAAADEVEFTLINRSVAPGCVASRVTLRFGTPAVRDAVSMSVPAGWEASGVPCQDGAKVCGFVWTTPRGLAAGQTTAGFRLVKPQSVRLHSLTVEVGGAVVELRLVNQG